MKIRITPQAVAGEVTAPPSKSYTHRAVIAASLSAGESIIESPLLSDDTLYTIEACRFLGAEIKLEDNRLKIKGTSGKIRASKETIFTGNSASTFRMMAPLVALAPAKVVLDGDNRLRQRPVGDLLSALKSLGAKGRSLEASGYPPIEIQGGSLSGGELTTSGETSSQHVSALLMIAPYLEKGLKIRVNGLRSRPYIDLTIEVMKAFGVKTVNKDYQEFTVKSNQVYHSRQYKIEGDYSSAAYFLAAGAIGGGPVTVKNLKNSSAQGDRHLINILSAMGCYVKYNEGAVTVSRRNELKGITIDMGDYPDLVPTVAVIAAYAKGKTEMTNIGHLKLKESNRLSDTAAELAKMGIKAEVSDDTLSVYGGRPKGAGLEAHNDHRLAMSLSIAALSANDSSVISGAESVSKSYPGFFNDLVSLRTKIEELP